MIIPTILITAYKKPEQLNHLINFFPDEVNIYIHLDVKNIGLLPHILNKKNVFIYAKYSVNWGGFNHLESILFLCNEAIKKKENEYFHLITGEDYPCFVDYDTFNDSIDYNFNYIEYALLPFKEWAMNGGLDRINMYHLNDIYNAKNKDDCRMLLQFLNFQYNVNTPKRKSFVEEFKLNLYGGSTWWSLNRRALEHVLQFSEDHKAFLYRFRYTFCSEEVYFQTILVNSDLNDGSIINNNLRYIDWNPRIIGEIPCYLDETDFGKMVTSNKIFARKLELDNILKFKSYLRSTVINSK